MMPSPHPSEVPMSQNMESQYIRTHQYTPGTGRLQQPTYPDPKYDGYNNNNIESVGPHTHRFPVGEFISPGFFQNVDPCLFSIPKAELEWKYNMRRDAQRILPFLYLGPWSCLGNRAWLKEEGFGLLFAIRDSRLAQARLVSGQRAATELGIEADSMDISNNQELISSLPNVIRRINDHLAGQNRAGPNSPVKKILLFCETGNGLSALVVISYLMVMLNLDLGHALYLVHSQRFCIDMDDLLKPLLFSFESILAAKRDVESAKKASIGSSSLAAPTTVLAKKRSFADRAESENMAEGSMDIETSTPARKPLAPFRDRWG
ncbi:hypothetical protein P175DRAFT_0499338 [Aspergillus ochraceoroseus IBT 24754]|uniref:Tyrosine specific protein phosphatases domain-containing protein n=2 Tax=Aspergillus ochraceoroseus TaxID=138278 RepID=A0A2T5M2N5_9EURO|nr:uncharacterized protein P175DRAFT_0499338 [Aspergillus ochraceoroseus IBT 24754]KKK12582.1 hypothetical protein AOCH_006122 [Aspergillus ochraceoroseus]PTU22795.1 hypothetical protein P175DRAFT_0499338 [Aspergillus ochraceoroseus IBT 24754]